MPKTQHSKRVDIITSKKPMRQGEHFITLDGEFVVKVYDVTHGDQIAKTIADLLTECPVSPQPRREQRR